MVIGPFLLPPGVFAFLIGVITLMILGALLKKFVHPRFDTWTGIVTVMAFVAARIGFVFRHWDTYQHNPLRILYIWQGGFDIGWAVIAAVLSVFFLRTWRHRVIAVGSLVVVAAAIMLAFAMTPKPSAQNLPNIALTSIDNESINLIDHADQLLVVNLWATWCGPCRREMPMLEEAIKDYPDVQFYFINQGESEQLVMQYLKDSSLAISEVILMDPNYKIAEYYQTRGTPVTLFFNKNKLVALHVGEISAELLSDRLNQLRL